MILESKRDKGEASYLARLSSLKCRIACFINQRDQGFVFVFVLLKKKNNQQIALAI